MMTISPEQRLVEDRYRVAVHRLLFRLALIVSIALMAQFLSQYLGLG